MSTTKIPENIKLKLWVFSGGRCEFRNCNELVSQDNLTYQEDNFAHMAHIVADSPDGPRGDKNLSLEMAKDFDNIMLVCLKHSKLIDGKNREKYSIEDLRQQKKEHEDRIRRQTALQPNNTTTILRFMANIGDRPVNVSLNDASHAILPKFSADEHGVLIDFTNRPGRGEDNFWTSFAEEIEKQVERDLADTNSRKRPTHISIFALGPIPLLMKLGNTIGNTISADLYQRHRDTENWAWKSENDEPFDYDMREVLEKDSKDVALVLSLSGKIHKEEVYKVLKNKPHLYEIYIEEPNTGFLNQKSRLEKFRETYRSLLSKIRDRHGEDVKIHIFPAIPAPIAVLCGRELLPKSDPSIIVYDHEKDKEGFIPILTIN